MKVFHELEGESSLMTIEDKEKVSLLKLTDSGKFMKGVGIRDGQFYVIAESDTDDIYLNYKAYMLDLRKKFEIPPEVDRRIFEQKTMEFHNKKAMVMKMLMERPR